MKQRIWFVIYLMLALGPIVSGQNTERIIYSTFSPQDWDIYISRNSGKNMERFTQHPSLDYDAVISPDGKWVVFTSERSGVPQLYVKAVDGDDPPVRIIESSSFQDQAAFSRDGTILAFVASHQGNAEIYILPFLPDTLQDISAAYNLTNHPGGDFRPSFSPDGKKIAFSSDRDHAIVPHRYLPFARQRTGDVYSADISGENLKRLTDSGSWDGSPVWSADGTKIVFYSGRTGKNAIFEMNADGSDQRQVLEYAGPAVSPKYLSDGRIAFTTWKGEQDFKIMQADPASSVITEMAANSPALMYNADIHSSGLMVFHGGEYPARQSGEGRFGFDGNVLARLPYGFSFSDQTVEMYGVRRAFAAPPQPGNTLLFYEAVPYEGFFEILQPAGFGIFWLPLLVLILFLTGIIKGVQNRRKIPFRRYLLFSGITVLAGLAVGSIFIFVDVVRSMPVGTIRLVMGLLTAVLLFLGWWQLKRKHRRKSAGLETHRLPGLYSTLFFGLSLFTILCAVCINQFVYTDRPFFSVDYLTEEKTPLFVLEKERNTNLSNFNVLDSKVSRDGKSLIITSGSFRSGARNQGDIWKYDFETRQVVKVSDSPHNDGFADMSKDGKMVFRSGRSGHFDIYLKMDGETVNLTQDAYRDNFPAISWQGDKIAFASDRLRGEGEYKTMDIFLMQLSPDRTWTEPAKISVGQGQNAHPHFSPDGKWIIYVTEGYGINDEQALIQPIIFSPQMYGELVAYNLETKERFRLTHNKWEDGTPLWVE